MVTQIWTELDRRSLMSDKKGVIQICFLKSNFKYYALSILEFQILLVRQRVSCLVSNHDLVWGVLLSVQIAHISLYFI